jgi:hypothetical protein
MSIDGWGLRNVSRNRFAADEFGLTRSQLCIVWMDRPTLAARMEKEASEKWRR